MGHGEGARPETIGFAAGYGRSSVVRIRAPALLYRLSRSKEDIVRLKTSARWKKTAARLKKLPAWAKGAIEVVAIALIALAILVVMRQPSSADAEKTPAAAAKNAAASSLGPVSYTTPGNMVAEGSAPKASAAAAKTVPVTITGCLERDDETFRLKDTTGVNAPTSRSWKSGFLKKKSASIEVVDAAHRLKLTDHVGQRVSVTGVLVDREMQVRSLQRVSTTCATNSRVKNSN
jgi:hypothetical protein